VTTTAQQVIDLAIQRSALNNADFVPVAQLLRWISSYERQAYLRAGRVNPDYFGKDAATAVRAAYTDSWDLSSVPGDIGVLTRVEVATIAGTVAGVALGAKVNLIGIRAPEIDVPPRAYVRGRRITSYGTELGAATINMVTSLKLYYSPIPALVTTVAQSVTLPDEWVDLIALPLAKVLAIRDRRMDEVQSIDAEYQYLSNLLDESALSFDSGVRRSFAATPAIPLAPPKQG
jgi:hypothetical protein